MTPRFSRRQLLTIAALGATGCRAPRRWSGHSATQVDVVILGAGLAGLAAAHRLIQSGRTVRIVEARARVGGRVLTLREPFTRGQFAEAGAIFVPATHQVTQQTVKDFGLELGPAFLGIPGSAYFLRDKLVAVGPFAEPVWPLDFTEEERALGWMGMYRKYVLAELRKGLLKQDEPDWSDPLLRPLDEQSFAEFLRAQGASDAAVELFGMGILGVMGDGIASVSALQLLRELRGSGGPNSQRIVGGSSLLPEAMAAPLASVLHLDVEVLAIEESEERVRVVCEERGSPREFSAQRAIVTLPTPVLRSIHLPPGLSKAKQRAIAEVGSTSVTRIYQQCSRRFWTPYATIDVDRPPVQLMDSTGGQEGESGILEGYTVGPLARHLGEQGESERQTVLREVAERVFPGSSAELERGTSYCWDQDPYALGGYAWFRPGQLTAHFAALRSVEGRLHFAGEHTSAWSGWMQGALESGERAANEVLRALAL